MNKIAFTLGDKVRLRKNENAGVREWITQHVDQYPWIYMAYEHDTELIVVDVIECFEDTTMVRVRYAGFCNSAPIVSWIFEKVPVTKEPTM